MLLFGKEIKNLGENFPLKALKKITAYSGARRDLHAYVMSRFNMPAYKIVATCIEHTIVLLANSTHVMLTL